MQGIQRPLSPHLQVYRWQVTMWLSSLHRITGLLLSCGAIVLGIWLIALAVGASAYENVHGVLAAGWFKVPLVVWTFCFFLHLANGIRHLVWDVGSGFERSQIRAGGWAVAVIAAVVTVVFWLVALSGASS